MKRGKGKEFEFTFKLNKLSLMIIFLAAVLVIAGLVFYLDAKSGISYRDKVTLKYSMFFEKDSTMAGEEVEIEFKAGNEEIFPEFEKNILGMKKGQKKRFALKAEDAFGKYDLALVQKVPRYKTIERGTTMSLNDLRRTVTSQYRIEEGEIVRSSAWPWKILIKEISEDTVLIEHMPVLNSLYTDPMLLVWPIKITEMINTTVTFMQMPTIGSVAVGIGNMAGKVVEISEDYVAVDYNHPLAGQDLIFEIEILEVEKPEQL